MIAPHFERLAKEHSRPKKVAFAKVNVDNQSTIAQSNAVAAMPTFKIYHNGSCVDTIKGANPPALAEAILKAVKLADGPGGGGGNVFKTPGRTLGSVAPARSRSGGLSFSPKKIIDFLFTFVGLYLVSLFSVCGLRMEEIWGDGELTSGHRSMRSKLLRTRCSMFIDSQSRRGVKHPDPHLVRTELGQRRSQLLRHWRIWAPSDDYGLRLMAGARHLGATVGSRLTFVKSMNLIPFGILN
jgi:thiol-disulfide isomerase/thioredoxin